jgi:hypothetical protein
MIRRSAAALVLTASLAACGRGSIPQAVPSPSASSTRTVGLVALGHSGLTGFGSDTLKPYEDVFDNSWATGTNPAVHSIYSRMLELDPSVKGHVNNEADHGAKADVLPERATLALRFVSRPKLVIIQTFDNDIRCDGTDTQNHVAFRASVLAAMKVMTDASPDVRILLLSQVGRPLRYAKVVLPSVGARLDSTGSGPCDLFDKAGHLQPAHVAHLTSIVEGYEREQVSLCATVPQCHTDLGAAARFEDRLADLTPSDHAHLMVTGQARFAELMWPTVQRLLTS